MKPAIPFLLIAVLFLASSIMAQDARPALTAPNADSVSYQQTFPQASPRPTPPPPSPGPSFRSTSTASPATYSATSTASTATAASATVPLSAIPNPYADTPQNNTIAYTTPATTGSTVSAYDPTATVAPIDRPPLCERMKFGFSNLANRWDVAIDSQWITRNIGRCVGLGYTDYNYYSGAPQAIYTRNMWSDDVEFSLAPGARVKLTDYVTDDMAFEFAGWGLQNWSVGETIYGDPYQQTVLAYTPYLQLSSMLGGFDNTLSYSYHSEAANAEINQRFKLASDGLFRSSSWLWGIRYFHLSDDFTLSGSDLYNNASETLAWHTRNNLVGAQGGLQWAWTWDRLQLSTEIKFGLYANIYDQHGTDTATGSTAIQAWDVSRTGTELSALFELGLLLRYQITDHLSMRGGYQYYGATGLALGSRQLNGYNNNGSVSMDGLFVGLELTR
jgi:hypothetical protein